MIDAVRPVPELIVASRNRAKIAAIERVVGGLAVVRPLPTALSEEADREDAATIEAIAAVKARRASAALPGALVIATDGGLLFPALGSAWDPRRTRRFAGEHATDRERAEALLALAAGLSGEQRRIGWREAMIVARNGVPIATWVAEDATGLLADGLDPRLPSATGSFWVPALWLCPEYGGRRHTRLSDDERNARDDHWSRLGVGLRRFLASPEARPRM